MDRDREPVRDRDQDYHALLQVLDKRVVTIGGGTGPFALLSTLKRYPCAITAIVTMADSGGSSRRLMDEFGQLPFGDLRQALVALSRKGVLWRDVFNFRFRKGNGHRSPDASAPDVALPAAAAAGEAPDESLVQRVAEQAGVGGHSLGNLIISALQSINDDNLLHAIADAQELLDTAGRVLPVTLSHATLCAELTDDRIVRGETNIDTRGERDSSDEALPAIRRLFLEEETPACDEAIRAIRRADILVIGPGDLYTSILPNLLVHGVAEAIHASEAQKVYVCNLMTKRGETDGFRASDFVKEIHQYLGDRVDRVILHDGSFPEPLLGLYAAKCQRPVEADVEEVRRLVPEVVVDQLLAIHGDHLVRHDADRLVRAVLAPANLGLSDLALATQQVPVTRRRA
ncbi:MAG TPA: gluconeogenesis factor YvcK family protein [Ktedonobacterales bacterium]